MRAARVMGWLGVGAVSVEVLYVVVMNAVLSFGVLERAISTSEPNLDVRFSWRRAWSPWPGRAYVRGFRLEVEDSALQFRLTIDRAAFNVAPLALLNKCFSASHVRAQGVRFELVPKVDRADRLAPRLAGFPFIEGFTRPALLAHPPVPPLTEEELARLWTVRLDDIDALLEELWLLEFRYRGAARVRGGFELTPLQWLAIDPSVLDFNGGMLSAGAHVLSREFQARAEVEITGASLAKDQGFALLHALTARLKFESTVEDFSVAELYVPGLHLNGAGKLVADLHVEGGRLMSDSALEFSMPMTDAAFSEVLFTGTAHATLSVADQTPTVRASASGALRVPMPGSMVNAQLSGLTAQLRLADDDLAAPLEPRVHVVLEELRIANARPILDAAAKLVPVIAPMVLGSGPLVASATAYVSTDYTLVRLKRATLGNAEFEGAAIPGANGWNGVAAGHFGGIPLGFRLRNGTLVGKAFTPHTWLGIEYLKAGIHPPD